MILYLTTEVSMYSNSSDLTNISPVYSHNPYDATSFPLLVLDVRRQVCVPPNEGFQMLHWHEEVQFVYVISGNVRITVYTEEFLLSSGDCMFLNRNSLHRVSGIGDCHYHSFLIPVRMLSFFSGSIMQQKDVASFTENPSFTCAPIYRSVSEYNSFLVELDALDRLYFTKKADSRHEYRLSVQITKLWLEFISLFPDMEQGIPVKNHERIRLLLSVIHRDYKKQLSVETLASAAHISKTECLRCFRRFVQESPYQYLIRYRLHMSSVLLTTTDRSVTDIALLVGFHSASSYIRYFKERYQMTPKQYRKAHAGIRCGL